MKSTRLKAGVLTLHIEIKYVPSQKKFCKCWVVVQNRKEQSPLIPYQSGEKQLRPDRAPRHEKLLVNPSQLKAR